MNARYDRRTITFLVLLAVSTLLLGSLAVHVSASQNEAALNVTPQTFDSLLSSSTRVAVFFSTTGCAACNQMRPLWQALAAEYSGSISFVEVRYSVGTAPLFQTYDVVGTPTFYLFVEGVPVAEHAGAFASPEKMSDFLEEGTPSGSSQHTLPPLSSQLSALAYESPSLIFSAVLGLGVFASPCVLPLLPGYVAFLAGRGRESKPRAWTSSLSALAAGTAGAVGILLVGVLFVAVGSLFWSILLAGRLLISFALMALGLAAVLGISFLPFSGRPPGRSPSTGHIRGITSYALMYGVLSLGCSLPFVIGGMLNILSGVGVYAMVGRLLAFAIGFSAPLAVLTYVTQEGTRISASRLARSSGLLQKIGGVAMIAASLLLLLTF